MADYITQYFKEFDGQSVKFKKHHGRKYDKTGAKEKIKDTVDQMKQEQAPAPAPAPAPAENQ